jgi:hypothetical protein
LASESVTVPCRDTAVVETVEVLRRVTCAVDTTASDEVCAAFTAETCPASATHIARGASKISITSATCDATASAILIEADTFSINALRVSSTRGWVFAVITDTAYLAHAVNACAYFTAVPLNARRVLIITRASLTAQLGSLTGIRKANTKSVITVGICTALIVGVT